MKIGDIVWSLIWFDNDMGRILEKRLAIIIDVEPRGNNCYTIALIVCGTQGRTSEKYLEPMETVCR